MKTPHAKVTDKRRLTTVAVWPRFLKIGNQGGDFVADDVEIGDLKERFEVITALTGLGRYRVAKRVLDQHGRSQGRIGQRQARAQDVRALCAIDSKPTGTVSCAAVVASQFTANDSRTAS